MSDMEIQAVLFDYGGVLVEEGFYNALVSLAKEQALDEIARIIGVRVKTII